MALVPNSVLDRYPTDLQAIPWHLLIADEALRYANPATQAHQALAQLRFGSVADCWLLTATPRGKSAEHLDVLVGLAVGDQAMITERLNTWRQDYNAYRPHRGLAMMTPTAFATGWRTAHQVAPASAELHGRYASVPFNAGGSLNPAGTNQPPALAAGGPMIGVRSEDSIWTFV